MSAMNETAMLALVLGNASVAPGFTDWCCQCCRTTFSKKADLRRHWRRPIPCEADGCRKSFRYDKFRSYRHHHRDKHSTDGVPLFDAGQLRNWFKRKRDEFKNVIDPIYCSGQTYHGLGVDSLVNNVMSNHEYGDTNGIEALPHPQSEPQGRLGDGGDSHTDGSSLSTAVPLDNRSSPFISTINTHQATLNHGQQTHWDRNTALTTNPQNWGMDFGFDSGTRPMRPADPGERERLLAEINARKAEYYDLNQENVDFDSLFSSPQFDTNSRISTNNERMQVLKVEIAVFQEEHDLLL